MKALQLILLLIISNKYLGELPLSGCGVNRPFKLIDNSCGSFNEVCMIKDDRNCEQLKNVCQQCPATNFSILLYQEIIKLNDLAQKSIKTWEGNISYTNDSYHKLLKQVIDKQDKMEKIFPIMIILTFVVMIVILILEIRFKLITKAIENSFNIGEKVKYRSIKKLRYDCEIDQEINRRPEINIEFLMKCFEIMSESKNNSKQFDDHVSFVKFDVNISTNTPYSIQLPVKIQDNIVKMKTKICAKSPNVKYEDFKRMKLRLNGTLLDDNEYLLSNIGSSFVTINCEIDESSINEDIIVLSLKGNRIVPNIIQIKRSENINDLKKLICNINSSINLLNLEVYFDSRKLKDEEIISNCNLKDFSNIKIIEKEFGDVIIKLLFNERKSELVDYLNFETVSELKIKLLTKLNCQNDFSSTDIVLLYKNTNLKDDDKLFEIDITNKSEINYWIYKRPNELEIEKKCLVKRDFSKLFKAKLNPRNDDFLILKRYKWGEKINDNILSDMIPYKYRKLNPGFVRLFDFYRNDKYLYCAMEYMEKRSFEDLKENPDISVTEEIIAKWCKQILQAMKYLFENKYDQGCIRPSCCLIDKNNNVKLSSFGLSPKLHGYKVGCATDEFINNYKGVLRYFSPESFTNENLGFSSNIWSFGAIIMEVATGKQPFDGMSESEAAKEIIRTSKIVYDHIKNNMTAKLKEFIDKCLVGDPRKRAKIGELRNNPFLTPV